FVIEDVTIYLPSVGSTQKLQPLFIADDTVIYTPTVTARNTMSPSLVLDGDILYAPRLIPGPVSLSPNRFIDLEIFYTPITGILLNTPTPPAGNPNNIAGNIKYVSKITMPQAGLILKMDIQVNKNTSNVTRM